VIHGSGFVFRYKNKGVNEAIVQKLARSISGLRASNYLMLKGYVQEVGVLFRVVDEIHEDICFLATALIKNDFNERHRKFLDTFFEEAVFSPNSSGSIPKPNSMPRKKVRAETFKKSLAHWKTEVLVTLAMFMQIPKP
jgi:hypothetical protein